MNCGYDKFMAFKLAFVNVKCALVQQQGGHRLGRHRGDSYFFIRGPKNAARLFFMSATRQLNYTSLLRRRLAALLTAVSLSTYT